MSRTVDESTAEFVWSVRAHLWVGVALFFVVGDVATTSVGLGVGRIAEVGPVVKPLVEHHGLAAMVVLKGAVVGGCWLLYRLVPRPHNVGVPLGLATLGVLVTGWNVAVLVVAVVLL